MCARACARVCVWVYVGVGVFVGGCGCGCVCVCALVCVRAWCVCVALARGTRVGGAATRAQGGGAVLEATAGVGGSWLGGVDGVKGAESRSKTGPERPPWMVRGVE